MTDITTAPAPEWRSPDSTLRVESFLGGWLVYFHGVLVFKSAPDDPDAAVLMDGVLFRRRGVYLLRNAFGEVRMPQLGPAEETLLAALMSQRTPPGGARND